MADLSDEEKEFLVVRLACYASPGKLRTDFKERFAKDVSPSQISYYNPLTAQGAAELQGKWKELFNETRAAYRAEVAVIPVSEQWYRMQRYQEVLDDENMSKSAKAVLKALEQAAKDAGGMYVRSQVKEPETGATSAQVAPQVDLSQASPAELDILEQAAKIVDRISLNDGDPDGAGAT